MQKTGRMIGGLLALLLAVCSGAATAAEDAAGRGFNHGITGFPLSGGHAAAACETCHVGGIFKGTPRNCDGCHAMGKRVIATPKPNSHIVTDSPCESCHFYTHSWLGARFNHGSAAPGQCRNCHIGRLAEGKPGSHATGNKATQSCDQCHRTFAWLPASWNHNGITAVCSSCHISDPQVTAPNRKPSSHAAPKLKGTLECDSCHNYRAWFPNRFNHSTVATVGQCNSCHENGTLAQGQPGGHSSFNGWPMKCDDCHTSTNAWLPALGALPSNHIPFNTGTSCSSCHVGGAIRTGATLHAFVSPVCTTCHLNGTNFLGRMSKKSVGHEGMKAGDDCSRSGCHRPAGNKGVAFVRWN
ncbi:hypothetical protein UT4_19390 [Ferrigenium sp. UT4]